jgi:hypothetical protein
MHGITTCHRFARDGGEAAVPMNGPTEPIPTSSADEPMDAPVAHRIAVEMAALTRVLFGVRPPVQAPPQLGPAVPEPVRPPEQPTPVVRIPTPPASLPMPGIPVVAPVPNPTGGTPEPTREIPRRPAGPSLELLQEIAFLEE